MADTSDAAAYLTPEDAARLTDFARACKAAARAVVLYPDSHPAIATTLGRIAQITAPPALSGPLTLTVRPDALLLDGKEPARPDGAIAELAALLHGHLVGELTVHPGGDVEAWRGFLLLLARAPDAVRADGGIARLWMTAAGRHVELREIDYASALRERQNGLAASWDQIIDSCIQGRSFDLDEETARAIAQIAGDPERFAELLKTLDAKAAAGGAGTTARTAAVLRLLRGVVDAVTKSTPEKLDPALRNMAGAIGQLSPEMVVELLARGAEAPSDTDDTPELITAVVSRMSDRHIASFVARNVQAEGTATDRLAQAFQTLVRDGEERQRLLSMAREDAAASPFGQTDGFQEVWDEVARKLLTSYTDKSYVSDDYGRSLSSARAHAIQVEQVSDDPPERMTRWLRTVATTALRSLDLQLLLDLLRIEQDPERWNGLMRPVVAMIDDLLLVGDFDAASQLIGVLVDEAGSGGQPHRRQTAIIAIDTLVEGQMMRHITTHLGSIDDVQFERVRAMAVSIGEVLVRPLAEALSTEDRERTRERLTTMLVAFGPSGRRVVERLKTSANPAVRRTAIHLLREFGGTEALPDLTELLNDREPQVQREAVRAILTIGSDSAFQILEQALSNGSDASRDAIMHSIGLVRDERATPLFSYILQHVNHRGSLSSVYLRAIESLGALRDPEAVGPLRNALYRGEWWAPRRTAALRGAAAAALARIGTPAAWAVLEEAASARARGVRAAARAQSIKATARVEPAK